MRNFSLGFFHEQEPSCYSPFNCDITCGERNEKEGEEEEWRVRHPVRNCIHPKDNQHPTVISPQLLLILSEKDNFTGGHPVIYFESAMRKIF